MIPRTILALLLIASPVAADIDPLVSAVAEASSQSTDRAARVVAAVRAVAPPDDVPVLLALAVRESHLRDSVERCATVGDDGRAIGVWQEHATGPRRERMCSDGLAYQARVAAMHVAAVRGPSMATTIARYAGRPVDHPIVLARLKLAASLAEVQ